MDSSFINECAFVYVCMWSSDWRESKSCVLTHNREIISDKQQEPEFACFFLYYECRIKVSINCLLFNKRNNLQPVLGRNYEAGNTFGVCSAKSFIKFMRFMYSLRKGVLHDINGIRSRDFKRQKDVLKSLHNWRL